MSTETPSNVESTRINYLSRLPNELLEDIFDHAYCTSPPPPMPISKRLLPFHQKHLYQQVSLSSSSRVKKFLASVSSDKEKGKLVKSLELKRKTSFKIKSTEALEKLFPLLPNLKHLGPLSGNIEISSRSKALFRLLPTVTSVSLETTPTPDGIVDLDFFSVLSALPSLDTLRVLNWPTGGCEVLDAGEGIKLTGVKSLSVKGRGAEDRTVVDLVKKFPALLHLELTTTYESDTSFSNCLPRLPSTLESLTLASTEPWRNITPYDPLLLRFIYLRSLHVDDGCYSYTIHKTLQQLRQLRKIRLGGGSISPTGFLTLVSGPTRLPHLETIIIDAYVGSVGRRSIHISELPEMEDWRMPGASTKEAEENDPVEDILQVNQIRQLIGVAGENGVEIEGTIHEALENLEDYWVEKSNRAILSAYNGNDIGSEWLREVRSDADEAGVTLPILDLDSLDSTRLELVQYDIPKRDRFMYSLRNREDDSSEEAKLELGSE